jgi:hypothetical protein
MCESKEERKQSRKEKSHEMYNHEEWSRKLNLTGSTHMVKYKYLFKI